MTPEQRLEQIERLMATTAKNINANTKAIAELRQNQAQSQAEMRAFRETMAELAQKQAQTDARIREAIDIIVDTLRVIRGVQVENQRILEHLFGERRDNPPEEQN